MLRVQYTITICMWVWRPLHQLYALSIVKVDSTLTFFNSKSIILDGLVNILSTAFLFKSLLNYCRFIVLFMIVNPASIKIYISLIFYTF